MKQAAERDTDMPSVGTGTPEWAAARVPANVRLEDGSGLNLLANAAELAEGVEDWLQPCKCTS